MESENAVGHTHRAGEAAVPAESMAAIGARTRARAALEAADQEGRAAGAGGDAPMHQRARPEAEVEQVAQATNTAGPKPLEGPERRRAAEPARRDPTPTPGAPPQLNTLHVVVGIQNSHEHTRRKTQSDRASI